MLASWLVVMVHLINNVPTFQTALVGGAGGAGGESDAANGCG